MIWPFGWVITMVEDARGNYCDYDIEDDDLANRLGKAFPFGSLVVIEGRYGTGKSVLSQRLAYGALKNGYEVSFVSSETDTYGFQQQMSSLGYDIKDPLLNQDLVFYPVFPSFERYRVKDGKYLSRLLDSRAVFQKRVIIVDCFSSLLKEFENGGSDHSVSKTLSFFNQVCSEGKIVILTIDPKDTDPGFQPALRSTADIFIELERETVGGDVNHILYLRRFSSAIESPQNVLKFRIEPEAGFIVDITKIS